VSELEKELALASVLGPSNNKVLDLRVFRAIYVCVCVYMYTQSCMHTYIYARIYTYVQLYTYIYARTVTHRKPCTAFQRWHCDMQKLTGVGADVGAGEGAGVGEGVGACERDKEGRKQY
jgi:hypothetical protein